MKLNTGLTVAAAALAMALSVPAFAQDKASLETVHAKAVKANTAEKHAAVARDYRLQAESFAAQAVAHEKEAAQLTRASGAMVQKWPAMTSRQLQNAKAKALEARRAQREILQLVAEGKSAKEIASVLNISPRTAETHKYKIMDELGVKTSAELVQYAIRHGLIAG